MSVLILSNTNYEPQISAMAVLILISIINSCHMVGYPTPSLMDGLYPQIISEGIYHAENQTARKHSWCNTPS